jgi:hypothetical protein
MESKIDILTDIGQIVSENFETGERVFYNINDLVSDEKNSYDAFMNIVSTKTSEPYIHIFSSESPIKRFVNINQESQEVLYDELSDSEKLVFDNFYNTFTK